jgi:hypothetical protein
MAMKLTQKTSNRRKLGWLAAVTGLSIVLSYSSLTWALDLDREIFRQNVDSAQILSTLGRDKRVNAKTSRDTERKMQVQLVRKSKSRRRG